MTTPTPAPTYTGRTPTMRSSPSFLAALALGQERYSKLGAVGTQIGERVEIDLALVAHTDPDAAEEISRYLQHCVEFWAGPQPAGPYIAVARTLVTARQQDGQQGRRDLREELDALTRLGGVGPYIQELTARTPDEHQLARLGAPLSARVEQDGDQREVTLHAPPSGMWPTILGGAPSPGEVRRTLQLRVSHANWRDRRVRRLMACEVTAVELWPDPAAGRST